MSANGAFTSSIDYEFLGGGVVQISGPVSVSIDPIFDATAAAVIYGQSSNTLDFTFVAGVETPTIYGTANLGIGFSATGRIEFGVQRFASSEWINRIPFTANSEGYVVVSAQADIPLSFSLDTNIYVFSEGPSSGSIDYFVSAKGVNVSGRTYSKIGGNSVKLDNNQFNDVRINISSNGVRIVDNGLRLAEVIQK